MAQVCVMHVATHAFTEGALALIRRRQERGHQAHALRLRGMQVQLRPPQIYVASEVGAFTSPLSQSAI